MTYLTETRNHFFALDSDHDLSAVALDLSTDDGVTWTTAVHATEPLSAADFPPPAVGMMRYWWVALFGPAQPLVLGSEEQPVLGRIVVAPETIYPTWTIYSDNADSRVPYCWPVDLGCLDASPWDSFPPEVQQRGIRLAVATLRMLTAGRIGGCPVTVRPCREQCHGWGTWMTYPVGYAAGGGFAPIAGWRPSLQSGAWVNNGCGCTGECGCSALSSAWLPGAILGVVTEVKVDGAILDATAYALDGDRLVRLDGGVWPSCQNLAAADTEPGTFSVTYATAQPGELGAIAAGRLALEYAKACSAQACALPANARSIARQGLTIDLAGEAGDYWPGGLTGIREVDVFIRSVNPYALRTPSLVWSPDVHRPRRVR